MRFRLLVVGECVCLFRLRVRVWVWNVLVGVCEGGCSGGRGRGVGMW